jgi:hypothetical protein
MKTLLTSMAVLLIAGTSLTRGDRTRTKADTNQPVKVSAFGRGKSFFEQNERQAKQN